jgi:ABC-type metal ion transport system substrate-binding protein
MSTMLNSLVEQFTKSELEFDGKNDYAIANTFLQEKGIRCNNKQVWSFIDAAKEAAGEAADW